MERLVELAIECTSAGPYLDVANLNLAIEQQKTRSPPCIGLNLGLRQLADDIFHTLLSKAILAQNASAITELISKHGVDPNIHSGICAQESITTKTYYPVYALSHKTRYGFGLYCSCACGANVGLRTSIKTILELGADIRFVINGNRETIFTLFMKEWNSNQPEWNQFAEWLFDGTQHLPLHTIS